LQTPFGIFLGESDTKKEMLWDSGAASEYEWLESFDDKEHDPSHEEEEDINCAVPRESDLGSS